MGRLFGTDGARGISNTEITSELAMKIGRATAMVLAENTAHKPKVIIGTDTRKSADMISFALASGLCSVGTDVFTLGVVPTPAVAFLVKEYGCDAGIMVSASHNPCEYNGIKVFQHNGLKLPDETEEEIEAIVLDEARIPPVVIGGDVGKVIPASNAVRDYINHIAGTADKHFYGMKIAVDCANGSASATAKELFSKLGAECVIINADPDGININHNCGSTHIEKLAELVKNGSFDAGFAFDGDADRVLAADSNGNITDGDVLMAIFAKYLKSKNRLDGNTLVTTVMSNMGLFEFCKKHDIRCEKTKVGDRYVLDRMLEKGYCIGGEQSGHIIFRNYASTGDGQLTAVQLLNIMRNTGKALSELATEIEIFPQILKNVKVSAFGKQRLSEDEDIKLAVEAAEKELGDTGRVLVRASGTEPLVRVMLEGKNKEQIENLGAIIARVVEERLI